MFLSPLLKEGIGYQAHLKKKVYKEYSLYPT